MGIGDIGVGAFHPMQSTPTKEQAAFSWRVATARHSLSRAQRRSTRFRFWWIQEGQAKAASLRLAGIARAKAPDEWAEGMAGVAAAGEAQR